MSGMIYIGNQTACFASAPREPFDYALAQGFDAFEWFPDKKPGAGWDEGDLDADARQLIRETARARGLRLSVHVRWQANLLKPDSWPLVRADLEMARALGAALLNVHLFHEQGLAIFVEAIRPLIDLSAQAGLQLAIENTPDHSPEQFNELFDRLRALESTPTRHVGMCFDPGHANLCAATRNDYLVFCDRLDRRVPLIHLHLHENWGDADTHLPLFTGPAGRDDSGIRGLLARLKERDFSGSIILEQWPHPPSLLDEARARLLQLWNANASGATAAAAAPSESSAGFQPAVSPTSSRQSLAPNPVSGGGGLETRDTAGWKPALQDSGPSLGREGHESSGLATELAAGNQRCRSWREKLDFVCGLLARESPAPSADQLIDIAIYLRFLGTGEIACTEDGRHFRPAHHARIAAQIQGRLVRLATPELSFIVRKILPWLPSSSPDFLRPEPLTRIRDIAHRNDIPSELKREIKNTLQNKLHRCAGPEDLATSAALLQRVTAPGSSYPPAFVEQFRLFHDELREFFNSRSLDERLGAVSRLVGVREAELIALFGDQQRAEDLPGRMAALRTLTLLRQTLLETALCRSAPESQELLLADIALEDFAFVLLSEIINACDDPKTESPCECQREALMLALTNLRYSGIEGDEAAAVEAELRAWGSLPIAADREGLLRLKATLLRSRRLAEDFSGRVVTSFAGRAEKLGRALGVADHALRVFAEAEVRSHLVFQVSKLATSLLRRIRERLGLPGWDVLVAGRAVGRVRMVDSLEHVGRGGAEPRLVLLKNAAGDEEIPADVAGLVLAHEMPHLSHLAVRARQGKVVFVACEEAPEFERLQAAEGQVVSLLALPDQVVWEKVQPSQDASGDHEPGRSGVSAERRHLCDSGENAALCRDAATGSQLTGSAATSMTMAASTARRSPRLPARGVGRPQPWLPLEEAVAETAGGKAAGVRLLAELSRQAGAGFSTPPAMAIPLGVMEAGLDAAPATAQEYWGLVRQLNEASPDEAATILQRLHELVHGLEVPDAITAEVARRFPSPSRLVVRSSANCEDLEELAGAGLYETVMNVGAPEVVAAIRTVWSSLWTQRATLSRQQAGLPHEQARMAVLIQEMLAPELSFVLHTVNPITQNSREVYAEIVVGLGETLASAASRGTPWRLVCEKDSDTVTTLAFANFSQAAWPDPKGGVRRKTVNYSQVELSRDANARARLGRRLAAIARFVERALGKPQDIEGAVANGQIYLVQTRPQPGLPAGKDS
jgi:phosphoglucan, water dikinase